MRIAFLAILVLFAVPAWAGSVEEFCEDEWPDDYRMQRHCMDKQREGAAVLEAFQDRYDLSIENSRRRAEEGDVPAVIYHRCTREWHPDFRMIAHCLQKQEEAAQELGKLDRGPGVEDGFDDGVDDAVSDFILDEIL